MADTTMSFAAKKKRQEAHRIISLLARGLDPADESELSSEACLNRPDVIRALLIAADALSISEDVKTLARSEASTLETTGRAGKPWTVEEDDRLRDRFVERQKLADIAAEHERTKGAIIARLVHLKLANDRDDARAYFDSGNG
jgi:hypothetical protein